MHLIYFKIRSLMVYMALQFISNVIICKHILNNVQSETVISANMNGYIIAPPRLQITQC